ncbi:MAG: acetyl-CoA C-acyltransferase [Waddliaceae bacterium]|nr:acetyl-CoA C-acyltransferase [Waddliaceae bacterium]
MKERIAIVKALRSPFCKAGGALKGAGADDLGAYVLKELALRSPVDINMIDEIVVGNVGQPPHAANVARVSALKAGLPSTIPAFTVHRNCASGMEALSSASNKILAGYGDIMMVGAIESMSNLPLLFNKKMTAFFMAMMRAKTMGDKLKVLSSFRLGHLTPIITLELGLTDPTCGMIMGSTAELLAREHFVTRDEQDAFALSSHLKAVNAIESGRLAEEIVPIPVPNKYDTMQEVDEGPRFGQTIEALQKLRPYFDRVAGTVTVGNSSQVTDGACAALIMKESKAKELNLDVLGYVNDYAYDALDGPHMGMGPVHATAKLLKRTGIAFKDFNLIEINEAFAAQALACARGFASDDYAKKHLGRDSKIGDIDLDIVNVNGGAIALGHPVGATGLRLIMTTLMELRRRKQNLGLATLCIGGGQGAAFALEVE